MDRSEILAHFLQTYAAGECEESLHALDEYYQANRRRLIDEFCRAFRQLCDRISQAQAQGRKGKIAYIYCSFLYTSLREGYGLYRFDAYDKEWFFDKNECAVRYDAQWAYQFLHGLCRQLNQERKKYVGRITLYDIDLLIREEAVKYGVYVESLAIQAIKEAVQDPGFAAIDKEDTVEIFIGEYKDAWERIYRYDCRPKDLAAIKAQLAEQTAPFTYEVWPDLDFHGLDLAETELSFTRFTGSKFNHTDFSGALLWGADFAHTSIAGADFSFSELPGADFHHARIKDSRFCRCDGEQCALNRETHTGHLPGAGFQDATLTNVDFAAAILNQANFNQAHIKDSGFSDAKLRGTSFQAANLLDCDFRSADLRETDFTGAALTNVDFGGSSLEGADFRGTVFHNCNFLSAELAGAVFQTDTDPAKLGLAGEQRQVLRVVRGGAV